MLMIWFMKVLNLSKIWAKSDSNSSKMLMIWSVKVLNLSKIFKSDVNNLICESIKFKSDLT